jgi:hypothetical protein
MSARYMPLKFPLELREPLIKKQMELELTVRQMFRKPRRIPFTAVLKAVLENKTYIPDDYIRNVLGAKRR